MRPHTPRIRNIYFFQIVKERRELNENVRVTIRNPNLTPSRNTAAGQKPEASVCACFWFLNNIVRMLIGGGERDRTDDPLLAKQVLSHLSYTPKVGGSGWT